MAKGLAAKVSSFQHGLDFDSPAFPLILRDVSCQRRVQSEHGP